MIIELFVAALCAFRLAATRITTSLINHLAYNAMLIASVTTVVFNANPLLRYDGYYILSDWLEIPNLQNKSREYILGPDQAARFPHQEPAAAAAAVGSASGCSFTASRRAAIAFSSALAIILMVMYQIPVIGVLMAIGGVITWACVPVVQAVQVSHDRARASPQARPGVGVYCGHGGAGDRAHGHHSVP